MRYRHVGAIHFFTIGRLTITWSWRRRKRWRTKALPPLRLVA
jgi:hypothetical protein